MVLSRYRCLCVVLLFAAAKIPREVSSFVLPSPWNTALCRSNAVARVPCRPCHMASSPDDEASAMRSMLESSWNAGTMGIVPTSPESAAEAASKSIGSALKRGKGILLVDLRLPAFDITQGFNIYDEISAMEFCTALAQSLQAQQLARKSLILVKDGSTVRSVSRILDAKDRQQLQDEAEAAWRAEEDEEEDDEDDDKLTLDSEGEASSDNDGTERSEPGSSTGDDIESFRKQLVSGWDENWDSDDGESKDSTREESSTRPARFRKEMKPSVAFQPRAKTNTYRLGSLFGDEDISSGADMFTDAVEAVDTHGSMDADEDALIILSPVSQEETVAVRRLVARYGNKKTIVLVNCRLDPEPKELFTAEPVYFISPLLAKATRSENNILGREVDTESPPTKIVIMRRYPRDWEVFLDVDGSGFELVDSAPAVTVGKTGPGNEWIAGCVKRHMQFKFGQ